MILYFFIDMKIEYEATWDNIFLNLSKLASEQLTPLFHVGNKDVKPCYMSHLYNNLVNPYPEELYTD